MEKPFEISSESVEFVHDHKDKLNNARLLIMTERIPLEGSTSREEKQGFMRKIEEYSKEEKGEKE